MPIPTFDLFKRDTSGRLIWLGVADDLKAAGGPPEGIGVSQSRRVSGFSQHSQKMVTIEAVK